MLSYANIIKSYGLKSCAISPDGIRQMALSNVYQCLGLAGIFSICGHWPHGLGLSAIETDENLGRQVQRCMSKFPKALSTLETIVADFGDSRRFRRQIVADAESATT